MKRKLVALLVIGAVLIGLAGCRWGRSASSALESSAPKVVDNPEAASEPVQEAAVKPLELPTYEVGGEKKTPVPIVKPGEPLEAGPVTITVKANSLTYILASERLPDGSFTEEKPDLPFTEFRVVVRNDGDGVLDLNHRKAYWITWQDYLFSRHGYDPRGSWTVAGLSQDNYLILPDERIAEELGYREADRVLIRWALAEKDVRLLPEKVYPGETVEGRIIFVTSVFSRKVPYYLCLGNWIRREAWG